MISARNVKAINPGPIELPQIDVMSNYATSGPAFDASPNVEVIRRSPTHLVECRDQGSTGSCLASFSADAPASATSRRSSHAYTIHTVHTGAACRTRGNDQFVCLMEGYGRQSLC